MTRRLTINLGVFAALAVLMTVWAFTSVVRFDFIDRPYRVTVEFESSPGLHPGFEVDYLGVRIGKIDSVRLEKSKVVVRLDIERGTRIPANVTAAAARKSAVGEPVVEITPEPGAARGPTMRPGTVIPVSKTKVPPRYGDLFGAVIKTLKAIDPNDARVLTHELAEGWSGREGSLRQIIQGGDQLTQTFADNTELLDGLTSDLGRIASVLNANRGDLGAGIDNLAALTGALRQVRGELKVLRDDGPELLSTVNRLLDKTGPDFECAVGSLADLGITRYNPDALADLRRTLRLSPSLKVVLDNVIGQDQGRPVLNVVFLVTLRKQATLEFKHPLPQPAVNPMLRCPGGRDPITTRQASYQGKNPGDTRPSHDPAHNKPNPPGTVPDPLAARRAAENARDSSAGPPVWLVYVPPVLALMVLIRVMAGSVPVLSRLPRPRSRRRRED
ncbi:MCE family protein [Actinomadura kijaniata]|uniref:MCE family protein n=1 Tax=Actinomadura kijaniata TaxID=46161 RepID=UPI0008349E29|nr:MlaD family protein [Actinomadura kijaniata]